jgi:chromosome segregation ATPase
MSDWKMCTHAGVVSKAECPWCKDERITTLESELAEARQKFDDAKERIVQLEDEYKYTRAAIREGLTDEQNVAHPVTREKVLFIREQRDALQRQNAELLALLREIHAEINSSFRTEQRFEVDLLQRIDRAMREGV